MNRLKSAFFVFFILASATAFGQRVNFLSSPYEVLIGPEVYYLERRVTEGGRQRGLLGGGRMRIERVHPCSLYLGLEGWGATGQLRGEDIIDYPMNSQLTDAQIEGRFGYSTFTNYCTRLLITGYFGYGKFFSFNNFSKNYRIPVCFHNEFKFLSAGFKTRWIIQPNFTIGFDAKLKSMFKGKRKITGDPSNDDATIRMGDDLQYSFDFPIQYSFCSGRWRFLANATPFYRIRNYGHQAHTNYDFYGTTFNIFGIRFMAGAEF